MREYHEITKELVGKMIEKDMIKVSHSGKDQETITAGYVNEVCKAYQAIWNAVSSSPKS